MTIFAGRSGYWTSSRQKETMNPQMLTIHTPRSDLLSNAISIWGRGCVDAEAGGAVACASAPLVIRRHGSLRKDCLRERNGTTLFSLGLFLLSIFALVMRGDVWGVGIESSHPESFPGLSRACVSPDGHNDRHALCFELGIVGSLASLEASACVMR